MHFPAILPYESVVIESALLPTEVNDALKEYFPPTPPMLSRVFLILKEVCTGLPTFRHSVEVDAAQFRIRTYLLVKGQVERTASGSRIHVTMKPYPLFVITWLVFFFAIVFFTFVLALVPGRAAVAVGVFSTLGLLCLVSSYVSTSGIRRTRGLLAKLLER